MVKPWLEDAFRGSLEATLEFRISSFFSEDLLKGQEEAEQRSMRNRIDKLESFANAALFLAEEMRKALPQVAEE